ncbi:transmembrane protein with metallophosphoesterase domain-like [Ylistrum balloti]|uniref:transmembrane protein with metallophosphoesterase domain-like n=1 Tax=Ylistrum balloti TaxID=509963 RepID=UPI0029058522|nr:transmembrane protein with metallophosphoesterase domain-like [Ylistrum balloti]
MINIGCSIVTPSKEVKAKDKKMTQFVRYIWAGSLGLTSVGIAMYFFNKWVVSLNDNNLKGRLFRAEFIVFIQGVLGCVSYFVWRNVANIFSIKKPSHRNPESGCRFRSDTGARIWKLVIAAYFCLAHGCYLCNVFLVQTHPHMYSIVSYFMLGFHVQMATGLVLVTILNFFIKLVSDQTLRHRAAVMMAVFYAVTISMYGFYNTRKLPTVNNVKIPVKDLPQNLEGLTITHLSDIHLGPVNGRREMVQIVKMVNDIQSDVVVIVGDLIDGGLNELRKAASPIKKIKSKYGTFFVTGNHEYYALEVDEWFSYLKSVGVTVLHNSNFHLPKNAPSSQQICVVGTDDLEASRIHYKDHGFHLDKAMEGCREGQPVLLLSHQPKAAQMAFTSEHRIDVVLSGHTHGGQMFPLVIGAYLANPYYVGLYPHGPNSHVYVSQGTNFWGIPMRTFTSREIAVITLTKKV